MQAIRECGIAEVLQGVRVSEMAVAGALMPERWTAVVAAGALVPERRTAVVAVTASGIAVFPHRRALAVPERSGARAEA